MQSKGPCLKCSYAFFIFVILKIGHTQKSCTLSRRVLIKLLQFSFNALLAILEPQRRPSILDFGVNFYSGSELSKKTFKMIATDAKNAENRTRSEFFLWRTKFWEAFCKRDWHNMRSYLFFNMQKLVTKITDSVCKNLYLHISGEASYKGCTYRSNKSFKRMTHIHVYRIQEQLRYRSL